MNRRQFLTSLVTGAASVSVSKIDAPFISSARALESSIELPKLPYAEDGLAPYISSNTVRIHHEKHHGGYVTKLNDLIKGSAMVGQSLEKLIEANKDHPNIFNLAAQIWNHSFYWESLRPKAGGEPKGKLKDKIHATFGDYKKFREEWVSKATGLFGSGWTWLVVEGNDLKIVQTKDADTPMIHNQKPLLTIDVWEHAYYLDYQNKRKDYVEAVTDHLINWEFAEKNFSKTA